MKKKEKRAPKEDDVVGPLDEEVGSAANGAEQGRRSVEGRELGHFLLRHQRSRRAGSAVAHLLQEPVQELRRDLVLAHGLVDLETKEER